MRFNEDLGWTIFGCLALLCIVGGLVSTQAYYRSRNARITEMVKAGADPISAAVALNNVNDIQLKSYLMVSGR